MNAVRLDDPLAGNGGGFFHEVLLSELNAYNPKYLLNVIELPLKITPYSTEIAYIQYKGNKLS